MFFILAYRYFQVNKKSDFVTFSLSDLNFQLKREKEPFGSLSLLIDLTSQDELNFIPLLLCQRGAGSGARAFIRISDCSLDGEQFLIMPVPTELGVHAVFRSILLFIPPFLKVFSYHTIRVERKPQLDFGENQLVSQFAFDLRQIPPCFTSHLPLLDFHLLVLLKNVEYFTKVFPCIYIITYFT